MHKEQTKRPCAVCGRVFRPLSKNGTYCTLGCRDAARRQRMGCAAELTERPCTHCGKGFVPHHHAARICSDECKAAVLQIKNRTCYYRNRTPARPQTRECLICGTVFQVRAQALRALTCKPECSYLLSRKRTADAARALREQEPEQTSELDRKHKQDYLRRKAQGLQEPKASACKVCSGPIDSPKRTTVCSLQCAGRARAKRLMAAEGQHDH